MMVAVVQGGTGTAAKIPGPSVAEDRDCETGVDHLYTAGLLHLPRRQNPQVAVAVVLGEAGQRLRRRSAARSRSRSCRPMPWLSPPLPLVFVIPSGRSIRPLARDSRGAHAASSVDPVETTRGSVPSLASLVLATQASAASPKRNTDHVAGLETASSARSSMAAIRSCARLAQAGWRTSTRRGQELERQSRYKIMKTATANDEHSSSRFRASEKDPQPRFLPSEHVSIYDSGEAEGKYTSAMEYLDGRSLKELILSEARRRLNVEIEYVRQYYQRCAFATPSRDRPPRHQAKQRARRRGRPGEGTEFGIARAERAR